MSIIGPIEEREAPTVNEAVPAILGPIRERGYVRHPAGSPRGGQFAATKGAAGAVSDTGFNRGRATADLMRGNPVDVPAGELEGLLEHMSSLPKGVPHPNLELLTVDGKDVFDGHNLGIRRKDMPQLDPGPREQYFADLQARGVSLVQERISPLKLHPSQNEISGVNSGKLAKVVGTPKYDKTNVVIVSSDGFVIDGHHRWSGHVSEALRHPATTYINCVRIGLPIRQALNDANAWTAAHGLHGEEMGANLPKWQLAGKQP